MPDGISLSDELSTQRGERGKSGFCQSVTFQGTSTCTPRPAPAPQTRTQSAGVRRKAPATGSPSSAGDHTSRRPGRGGDSCHAPSLVAVWRRAFVSHRAGGSPTVCPQKPPEAERRCPRSHTARSESHAASGAALRPRA